MTGRVVLDLFLRESSQVRSSASHQRNEKKKRHARRVFGPVNAGEENVVITLSNRSAEPRRCDDRDARRRRQRIERTRSGAGSSALGATQRTARERRGSRAALAGPRARSLIAATPRVAGSRYAGRASGHGGSVVVGRGSVLSVFRIARAFSSSRPRFRTSRRERRERSSRSSSVALRSHFDDVEMSNAAMDFRAPRDSNLGAPAPAVPPSGDAGRLREPFEVDLEAQS
jgi:hypothetical protein